MIRQQLTTCSFLIVTTNDAVNVSSDECENACFIVQEFEIKEADIAHGAEACVSIYFCNEDSVSFFQHSVLIVESKRDRTTKRNQKGSFRLRLQQAN
jgi:hypothetical protein